MLEELAGGNAEIPQLEATLNSKSQLPDQIQAAEKDLSIVSTSIDEEQKILDGLKDAPMKKMIANELKDKLVYTSQAFQRRSADIDSRDELLRISEAEVAKLQSEIEANNDGNKALDAELDKLGRDREEAPVSTTCSPRRRTKIATLPLGAPPPQPETPFQLSPGDSRANSIQRRLPRCLEGPANKGLAEEARSLPTSSSDPRTLHLPAGHPHLARTLPHPSSATETIAILEKTDMCVSAMTQTRSHPNTTRKSKFM